MAFIMQVFGPFVELFSIRGIDILGNMDSGAVVGLTKEAAIACRQVLDGRIDAVDIRKVDEKLFEFLVRGGYFEQEPKHAHPKSAYVHVTQRCNLCCVGCYSMGDLRNCVPDPSLDDLHRVFDQLSCNGVRNVNISGGEPFLRDDLCEVVRIANEECGIPIVNIVTNGTVVDECNLDDLAKRVSRVVVSIDGVSADAPAYVRRVQRFETLVETVHRLKAAKIRVRILPTLHAKNIDDLPAYMDLARDLGVEINYSLLSCPPEIGEMRELVPNESDLTRLAELQDARIAASQQGEPFGIGLTAKRLCGAGCKNLSVDADGGLYPCHMLQSDEFLMGNVFQEDLGTILERTRSIASQWLLPIERIDGCRDCEFSLVCGGGCRARTINGGAQLADKDPYCALSKGFYEKMFEALKATI